MELISWDDPCVYSGRLIARKHQPTVHRARPHCFLVAELWYPGSGGRRYCGRSLPRGRQCCIPSNFRQLSATAIDGESWNLKVEVPQRPTLTQDVHHSVHHPMLSSLSAVQSLLNDTLRVTVTDGRIFLGTFVGTDSELNILLLNTDEFRLGPNENPNGRFVGQVMIPWRLVRRVEARLSPQSPDGMFT